MFILSITCSYDSITSDYCNLQGNSAMEAQLHQKIVLLVATVQMALNLQHNINAHQERTTTSPLNLRTLPVNPVCQENIVKVMDVKCPMDLVILDFSAEEDQVHQDLEILGP